MKKLLLSIITIVATGASVVAADRRLSAEEAEAFRFADGLLRKMTLQEKIGQLQQFRAYTSDVTGPDGEPRNIDAAIRNGEVGSLIAGCQPQHNHRLQRIAVEESRLGIPLILGCDIIHGCRITFPENLAMSCSWDIPAIEQSARIAAEESVASGLNWTFSPMCDRSSLGSCVGGCRRGPLSRLKDCGCNGARLSG